MYVCMYVFWGGGWTQILSYSYLCPQDLSRALHITSVYQCLLIGDSQDLDVSSSLAPPFRPHTATKGMAVLGKGLTANGARGAGLSQVESECLIKVAGALRC